MAFSRRWPCLSPLWQWACWRRILELGSCGGGAFFDLVFERQITHPNWWAGSCPEIIGVWELRLLGKSELPATAPSLINLTSLRSQPAMHSDLKCSAFALLSVQRSWSLVPEPSAASHLQWGREWSLETWVPKNSQWGWFPFYRLVCPQLL